MGEGVARVIPFFTCEHLLRFAVDFFFLLLLFLSYLLIIVRGVFCLVSTTLMFYL